MTAAVTPGGGGKVLAVDSVGAPHVKRLHLLAIALNRNACAMALYVARRLCLGMQLNTAGDELEQATSVNQATWMVSPAFAKNVPIKRQGNVHGKNNRGRQSP
jgi:hypothetical protein